MVLQVSSKTVSFFLGPLMEEHSTGTQCLAGSSNGRAFHRDPHVTMSYYLFCLFRFACRFCFLRIGDFPSAGLRRDKATKKRSRTTMRCCRRTTDSVVPAASCTSLCCSLFNDWRHSLRRGSSEIMSLLRISKVLHTCHPPSLYEGLMYVCINFILEWTTRLDTSSRTSFVREGGRDNVSPDVHVTLNVELRNNVRLLLNVELRKILCNMSDCYLNIVVSLDCY